MNHDVYGHTDDWQYDKMLLVSGVGLMEGGGEERVGKNGVRSGMYMGVRSGMIDV